MQERAFAASDRPPDPFSVSCSAGGARNGLSTSLQRFAYRLAFVVARAAVEWAAPRPARIPPCPALASPPAPARLAQPGVQGRSPLGPAPCDGLR